MAVTRHMANVNVPVVGVEDSEGVRKQTEGITWRDQHQEIVYRVLQRDNVEERWIWKCLRLGTKQGYSLWLTQN